MPAVLASGRISTKLFSVPGSMAAYAGYVSEPTVLTSVKGPNGGYRLAKPANEITMLEILEAVEGPIRGNAPSGYNDKDNYLRKRLDDICNQSAEQIRKQLGKVKISELASKE